MVQTGPTLPCWEISLSWTSVYRCRMGSTVGLMVNPFSPQYEVEYLKDIIEVLFIQI